MDLLTKSSENRSLSYIISILYHIRPGVTPRKKIKSLDLTTVNESSYELLFYIMKQENLQDGKKSLINFV